MYDYYPVGKISIQASTNGSFNLLDIFQHKMNDLFHGFEFIRAYIDNLLVLTKGDLTDHVHKLLEFLIIRI